MLRFFLAHSKSDTPDLIESRIAQARRLIEPASKGQPFEIITGRDFFAAHFKRCGSWESWHAEVATGIDYVTREPQFHAILVPGGRSVGAATAQIARKAIEARKPVFVFGSFSEKLIKVSGVRCINVQDWQRGWELY